jgi:head-tail adaptor
VNDPIGALRARVQLQRPSRVADELGGATLSWVAAGFAWASIEALSAGESGAFDAARGVSIYRITLNRRADIGVGWRVIWGARVLRTIGARDDGARRMTLDCEEERA